MLRLIKTLRQVLQNRYVMNSMWQFTQRACNMLLTFFVSIALIRYLGPNQYGIWAYALSFVSLFTAINTFGLESIVVRDLLRGDEVCKNKVLGSAFFMMLAGSVLMFVIVCIIAALSQGV